MGSTLSNVWAVVPTFKREDFLERCVRTLREQGIEHVVVVHDVAPTHAARNQAIAQVPEDAMVFSVDDDCWYDERLRLADTLARMTETTGIAQVTRIMRGKGNRPALRPAMAATALCWGSGGMLFRRRVWSEVGGYPADYLDDVTFSARVYAAGYRNVRSTFSYGHHDVDTKRGGMFQAMKEHPANPCNPADFMITGEPCMSKGGIPNIKNIRPLPALHDAHRAAARAKGWSVR